MFHGRDTDDSVANDDSAALILLTMDSAIKSSIDGTANDNYLPRTRTRTLAAKTSLAVAKGKVRSCTVIKVL